MGKESEFDSVNVRTWKTKDNPKNFPEIADASVAVPWLKNRPSFGIAFSGGGTRSATATLGQLRALRTLGWLDQARHISANSGGSWTSVPYVYLPEQFDDNRFLGEYIPPSQIDDAKLTADEDLQSMEGTIFHSRVVDIKNIGKTSSLTKGDESYSDFVGKVFLERFGLHDKNKFFSSHENALQTILQGNPALNTNDFYLTRKNRPFLIVVGTLLTPSEESYLIEATPLYVGVRHEFTVSSQADDTSKKMLIGGGYTESFGYDSYEPKQSSPTNDRWTVQLKGKISRGDLLTNKRYRFTLSDMIGMSSAAPHITLKKKGLDITVFPEFRHWAIDRQHVKDNPELHSKAKELVHGDGGDIDNLALMPLLARRIKNIIVFINTRTAFSEDVNCDNITTDILVDDVISLFQATGKLKHNAVFADGEAQLYRLCREFKKLKLAGEPLVYSQRYKIRDNFRHGIDGEDYTPTICWVYLDRSQKWIDKLPDGQKLTNDLKTKHGDFDVFPHYKTFGEQDLSIIDLDPERVRALSNLTAWTIFDSASYIAENLSDANLKTDNLPEDFN